MDKMCGIASFSFIIIEIVMAGQVLDGSVIICGIIEYAISDPIAMPPLARFLENWEYMCAKPLKNHYLGNYQRIICVYFSVLSKGCFRSGA
jgi:hypothetical protein